MKNKTMIIAVVAVLLLLILLGNWGFVLGFALAIAICWFFGFEQVKAFVLFGLVTMFYVKWTVKLVTLTLICTS